MSDEQTIGHHWEEYARAMFPDPVSDIQYQETRRAFYGGARAFLSLATAPPDSWTDAEIDDWFRRIHLELEAFKDSVLAGDA